MIDYGNNILEHKGRINEYGEAIQGKNSGKYVRYFEIPSPHPSGKPLDMEVDYYPSNDRSVLQIKGSWRKWYLGAGTTRDLTYMDTVNCIGAIAQKTGLPVELILRSRFVTVEIGLGLRFRENMEGIIDGFVYFKGFDIVYEYGRESVKFKGSSYSVSAYDKFAQLMSDFERRTKEVEKLQKRKGVFPYPKRLPKTRLAEKLSKKNFSLRFEVRVSNLKDCPPEFTDRNTDRNSRKVFIRTPEKILENWDLLLLGLQEIFYNVQYCSYNLQVGRNYLEKKGVKDLAKYELHLAAISVGGVRNYVQLHLKMLKGNHRNENIEKRIELLNNPPEDLKKALRQCRSKEQLLFKTFNETIDRMGSKRRFRRVA